MEEKRVTVATFISEIRDKQNLHEALIRHGYYLPSLKSGICTEWFLMDISMGLVWCPKYDEIRLQPCPR